MENSEFLLLIEGAEAEIVEKKSRFIATIQPVSSEEEALAFVAQMKKKYYDARHNCWAFIVGTDNVVAKCSDDGEPSGTAGRPMLEVLTGSGIHNIVVVVTRYFGGVLLGTGGLVRAYQGALKEALPLCKTATQRYGVRLKIKTDYNMIGKIQYILANNNINIEDSVYGADVELIALVPIEDYNRLTTEITKATSAKAVLEEIERTYFFSSKPNQAQKSD
jgi:uncharacterized YigZ family protein